MCDIGKAEKNGFVCLYLIRQNRFPKSIWSICLIDSIEQTGQEIPRQEDMDWDFPLQPLQWKHIEGRLQRQRKMKNPC